MDKRSLYDGLNQLESELRNTLTELVEMKHALHEIVEKIQLWRWKINVCGEHLRELNQVAQAPAENVKQELSKSRMNLEKIYEEGFHVCYDLYGSRRDNDEPCAFCLEVIYRESGR
ncbi:DNA replication initiation control protein YabA [Enterococcus faecium]|nr:DNA replication initiation control protein YabA [Enterococcus faecium]